MQTFLKVVTIVVLMAPLLAIYGVPFIVSAKLFHSYTVLWLRDRTRLVFACGIASLGVAPAFDAFWAPKSIYLRLFDGDPVNPGSAALSIAVTWIVLTLTVGAIVRMRSPEHI